MNFPQYAPSDGLAKILLKEETEALSHLGIINIKSEEIDGILTSKRVEVFKNSFSNIFRDTSISIADWLDSESQDLMYIDENRNFSTIAMQAFKEWFLYLPGTYHLIAKEFFEWAKENPASDPSGVDYKIVDDKLYFDYEKRKKIKEERREQIKTTYTPLTKAKSLDLK